MMKKLALFCFLFLVSILQLPAVYHTVGYYPGSGETGELAIHDNIGYLTAGSNGLKVLDLADPTNPTVIGSDST
jgi:hypothetical protein